MATAKKVQQKRHETASLRNRTTPAPVKKAARKAVEKPRKETAAASKPTAPKKPAPPKLERDTFRMPDSEFDGLRKLKARAKSLGVPAKKSEILRAGLRTLHRMDDEHFAVLLAQVQAP